MVRPLGGEDLIPEEVKLLIKHTADPETREDIGVLLVSYIAVELTKLCIEHGKTPKEVLEIFEEIKSGLI